MNKGRKVSGGKYHSNRKKKSFETSKQERTVTLGDPKSKTLKVRGGHVKTILLNSNNANISTSKGTKKTEITNVLETPQNKFLARQNRLIKSAIIETPIGKAKITNRPSREGSVNAILIKE